MDVTESFDLQALWRQTLADVTPRIPSPVQREWLGESRPVGFSQDTVIIATPHSFAREWLQARCTGLLQDTMSAELGRPLSLMITVEPPGPSSNGHPGGDGQHDDDSRHGQRDHDTLGPVDAAARAETSATLGSQSTTSREVRDGPGSARRELAEAGPPWDRPEPAAGPPGRADRDADQHLNPKYTFDAFVIGSSNRFAHAASRAVAEAPTQSYNPLFVYGGAGLGKTHLLHAIGHYIREWYPRMAVRYVPTDQFIKDFINSIQHGNSRSFQHSYRQADVLLIDDIQFIERAERTQEEFFHTFNALHMAERQIVITSDRPPKQMAQLEDRLRSRFEWGLIVDVQPPDLETRIAILRRKAEVDGASVPDDVLELIATKVQSNIRELEGALIRVAAFASIHGQVPSTDAAGAILKDLFPDDRTREINVDLIMDEISQFYSVSVEDLCSKSRRRQLTNARQIAMWFTREMTEMSLPEIGRAFGGRDHSTVLHAKNKIDALIRERAQVYDQVDELTTRIKARARGAR